MQALQTRLIGNFFLEGSVFSMLQPADSKVMRPN
jgi:hypothetical protein